ncbi:GIY-YIG nuclease family protein [Trinickia mobilis]|uniref:GIY-YIG nuclease family protein n=1 Tax=Trinickia mobilis TaxID=2816356 RepID=UPI001A8FB033|nr:GIY-YIG nuclease family protein [Trinickia mobilis]
MKVMNQSRQLFDQENPEAQETSEALRAGEAPEQDDAVTEDAETEDVAAKFELADAPRDFAWNPPESDVSFAIKGSLNRPGLGSFELNLNRSLAQQLGPFFDSLETAPLTRDNLGGIDDGVEGVYALYINDELSYVGKSDARRGLKARLRRHRRKLSNRVGISVDSVHFKAAQIFSFAALDVEALLLRLARQRTLERAEALHANELSKWESQLREIEETKPLNSRRGESPHVEWTARKKQHREIKPVKPTFEKTKPPFLNNSGFGSNDTGKERDTQKASDFDLRYSLDMDSHVDAFAIAAERIDEGTETKSQPANSDLYSALQWFATNVCFTFRVEGASRAALSAVNVECQSLFAAGPMREVLSRISAALPDGWRISLMRGKVLAYNDASKTLRDVQMHFIGGAESVPSSMEASHGGRPANA